MKVFITRKISEAGLQLLRDANITITEWTEKRELTPQELIDNCKQNDALLSVGPNKINSDFLNECRHLKVIALLSVGFDNVDVATATSLKIPIGNTPGVLSAATADTAFLLMLAVSRKAFFHHKRILNGDWGMYEPTANLGIELQGRTLGVLGLGKIGYEMAKRCSDAFKMNIIYHNRSNNFEAEEMLEATKVSFEELLAQSDVLTVHTELTPETKGIFNKETFSKMKPNSIFINTARGAIHDELDLTEALQNKTIWGAGLDVTNPEPMQMDNPLLNMPNLAILPHIGSGTEETRNAMAKMAAENIIAGLNGEKLKNLVNPDVY